LSAKLHNVGTGLFDPFYEKIDQWFKRCFDQIQSVDAAGVDHLRKGLSAFAEIFGRGGCYKQRERFAFA
jgi:hypothetical protein